MYLTLISKNRTIIKHASLPQLRGKVRLVDRLLQSIIHFSTGSFSFRSRFIFFRFIPLFLYFFSLLLSCSISFLFISLFITTPCSQLYRACLQSCENSVLYRDATISRTIVCDTRRYARWFFSWTSSRLDARVQSSSSFSFVSRNFPVTLYFFLFLKNTFYSIKRNHSCNILRRIREKVFSRQILSNKFWG